MIAVIDSGVANLASVMAALHHLGAEATVSSDRNVIAAADKVILPGVGAAAPAMARLKKNNLDDTVRQLTAPVLGICLGMQLLFEHSEESGGVDGIGVLSGTIAQLHAAPGQPVPHMGWNDLTLRQKGHPLLQGLSDGDFVYYVHSFAAPVSDTSLATTTYGTAFTAIAGRDNFFGCQFHPERSSKTGARILKNFIGM